MIPLCLVSWSNVAWFFTQHSFDKGRTWLTLWTLKRHPTPCPHGQGVGIYLYNSILEKINHDVQNLFFMPPPLGAGGIMFSGCPSVRPSVCPSVRPSVRPKPEIPSFDLYMGPLVHPTNRNRFTACPSVRPSGEVSGHLPENAWRDWPEILYADVSWPSPELISLWLWSVDFSNFGTILT